MMSGDTHTTLPTSTSLRLLLNDLFPTSGLSKIPPLSSLHMRRFAMHAQRVGLTTLEGRERVGCWVVSDTV